MSSVSKEKMKEIKFTLAELNDAARAFIDAIGNDRVFLFQGEMGAGKTTLIAEICRQLGADDDFGSPTFSIVNEYQDANGHPIFHFDLYRIEEPREIIDMGATEYFDSGALCLVEWPDRLGELTPPDARIVEITLNEDDSRTLRF